MIKNKPLVAQEAYGPLVSEAHNKILEWATCSTSWVIMLSLLVHQSQTNRSKDTGKGSYIKRFLLVIGITGCRPVNLCGHIGHYLAVLLGSLLLYGSLFPMPTWAIPRTP